MVFSIGFGSVSGPAATPSFAVVGVSDVETAAVGPISVGLAAFER